MLRSITLQNFKSFGVLQKIPLEPITVLVGPNNSGKSNLLSVGKFVSDCVFRSPEDAVKDAGGVQNIIHRPAVADGHVHIGWSSDEGSYLVEFFAQQDRLHAQNESMSKMEQPHSPGRKMGDRQPFDLLKSLINYPDKGASTRGIWRPLLASRRLHLALNALREDAQFVTEPRLTDNGAELASVVALWRSAYPEKSAQLDDFLRRCLPEVKFVLALPSHPGLQRLWVEQKNGQRFDAPRLSEGMLCFIAMAMHIIDLGPETVLFIEEPERSIHPQRLHELVELMRLAWHERRCQFVLSTHSPVLLDDFRDVPESIILFRRDGTPEQNTLARRLADLPGLMEELGRVQPGEMLEAGVFQRDFKELES
jgi:predicted ATPase